MKQARFFLLLLIAAALTLFSACGASGDTSPSGNAPSDTTPPSSSDSEVIPEDPTARDEAFIEINSFTVGYLTEDDYYRYGGYSDESITDTVSFPDDENRYMVLDFSYTLLKDIGYGNRLSLSTELPGRGVLDITIEDAPTSKVEETEGLDGITLRADFTLPTEAGATADVRVILRLLPVSGGSVPCTLTLSSADILKIYGKREIAAELNTGEPRIVYEINPDGRSYSVVSANDTMTAIYIPDKLNDGLPVTAIKPRAFDNCIFAESVRLGAYITEIGAFTFADCRSLRSIELPSGLTTIGEGAFYKCSALRSIVIGKSVTAIGLGAFENCTSLESITLPFTGDSSDGSVRTDLGYIFSRSSGINTAIPKSLRSVSLTGGTAVYPNAFYACEYIEHITLPEGITTIGANAFYQCASLVSVNLPDTLESIGKHAFSVCSDLTAIRLPESVRYLYDLCFSGCSSLTEMYIPKNTSYIGDSVFAGCGGLLSFNVSSDNKSFESFDGDLYKRGGATLISYACGKRASNVTLREGVTTIAESAFYGCTSLIYVELPSTLKLIDDSAFDGCVRLASVTLPKSLSKIGVSAFSGCENLYEIINHSSLVITKNSTDHGGVAYYAKRIDSGNSVIIKKDGYLFLDLSDGAYLMGYVGDNTALSLPSDVNGNAYVIANRAFMGTNIESIAIPSGVIGIGARAFEDCTALTRAEIASSGVIGDYAFTGCISLKVLSITEGTTEIGCSAFRFCEALFDVVLPNSVTNIGEFAFDSCYSLGSVRLGNGLTEIGTAAFQGCVSLRNVDIPDCVKSVGDSAFGGCSLLASLSLGESVEKIGGYAFSGTALRSVTLPATVKTIGQYAFGRLAEVINHSSLVITAGSTDHGRVAKNAFVVHSGESRLVNVDGYLFYTHGGINYLVGYVGEDTELVLPESFKGDGYEIYKYAFYARCDIVSVKLSDKVSVIGEWAFCEAKGLTAVDLGDGVRRIDGSAFRECTGLTSIHLPASLTALSPNAFDYCRGISNIGVSNDSATFSSIDGNLYSKDGKTFIRYAFGKTDKIFALPDTVSAIGESAFLDAVNLQKIILPDGLERIGASAFYACERLRTVKIPDGVKELGGGSFGYCSDLRTVTLGNGITVLYEGVFASCTGLTGIVIPRNVTAIRDGAFTNCNNLKSITMPSSVTQIYPGAFGGNTSVEEVYYEGNEQQWKEATRATAVFNKATVHFGYLYEENDG